MTDKEAIKRLKNIDIRDALQEDYDALHMAIQALEQQPSEDCISRQAVLERLKREEKILYTPTGMNYLIRAIKEIPSVTPQPKMGKWLIVDDCELFMAKCSECGEIVDSRMINKYPYCHCGAKMEVEE